MTEKDILDLEMRKNTLETGKVISMLLIAFLAVGIFAYAVYEYYEFEQKKLDLARYQFEVQAAQTNRSLQLQAVNESIKFFDILMNSRLVDTAATNLLGTPKEVGNQAKDLAMKLIDMFNVNLECTPNIWICDDKDKENEKTTLNSSTNGCQCQNMPTNIPEIGNNNRENLSFVQSYRASATPIQNLEYLKDMLDKKLITQAEYDAKKAELLSKM